MRVSACVWTWLALGACAPTGHELLGQVCAADRECGELVCAADLRSTPADLAALALACAEPIGAAEPGQACTSASECAHGVCLLAGACARSCERSSDCQRDQRCQSAYARTGMSSLAEVHSCVAIVDLPDNARVEQTVVSGALHAGREVLRLPAFEPYTLYVVEHPSDHSWPVPAGPSPCRPPLCARRLSLESEPERVLFDVEQVAELRDGPDNPVAQGAHVQPLTVWAPNGSRLTAEARGYLLEVESKLAADARITLLSRAEPGARLDLNLYYVGVDGLTPEGDRGGPTLAAALEEVDRIFEPAGIYLGEVRQNLIPGMLPRRGSGLPDRAVSAGFSRLISQYQVLPELPELLRMSAGAANVALDVFLVADIDARAGGDVSGMSAGTPVALGMHGSPGSGIVIAVESLLRRGDSLALGHNLAHEIGHALGLFHTTELDGVVMDPLPDTPTCPLARDLDGSGTLDARECAAHGGNNLMFPTSDAGTQLTSEQSAVLRRALILQ